MNQSAESGSEFEPKIELESHLDPKTWLPLVLLQVKVKGYRCDEVSEVKKPSLFSPGHKLFCDGGKHGYRIEEKNNGLAISPL